MGDLKSNTYGYLNLAWSICSLLVCALYNPYQSCKYCRTGKPPGHVMLPFSFGVALLSQHVISLSLAKFPFLPCLVVQIFLGLAVQNYSTFIWIQADEYVLKELSKICRTEEEILLYWWYIMVMAGIVVTLVSFTISSCSRGHIYFKNGLQIKPWTCSGAAQGATRCTDEMREATIQNSNQIKKIKNWISSVNGHLFEKNLKFNAPREKKKKLEINHI